MWYTCDEVMQMPTAKTRAVRKYNDKAYDRISIVVPKGQKKIISDYARAIGMTTNGFITALIRERIEKNSTT